MMMMERFFSQMRIIYISNMINAKNFLPNNNNNRNPNTVFPHPLTGKLFDTLNKSPSGIYVHWGVYESGKSTAAKNAGLMLQNDSGRLVTLLNGYDFSWKPSMRSWLRTGIGIPDYAKPLSTFFNKPTTIIIDHFDLMMRDKRCNDTLDVLRELADESVATQKFNILLIVTSWERAIELRDIGCTVIESPSRWTKDQLSSLFSTFPATVKEKYSSEEKEELMNLATLAGTPGYLTFEAHSGYKKGKPCPRYASIFDLEWRKGTAALTMNGKPPESPGRFPDKDGIYHHEDLKCTTTVEAY